jgi:multidrug efflux pump subunit AcrB
MQQNNANLPTGNISYGAKEQLVRVEGKITDPRAFNKIIVARRASLPVYLEQVADVIDGEKEETSMSRIDGKRAITLDVAKVQEANIVEVGKGIERVVEELKAVLPADVSVRILDDESKRIQSQLDNVKRTIFEGAILTMVIVFLFLHSWRSTIITGLTLPISVMASFIAMKFFGFTLNFLTLMALSLCIGLLIDDAIVVRENIVRHLGMGKDHVRAANEGTSEIGLAVMATTFAIVAVFVPVAFMDGIIGRFFLQFGITVAVAVLVSLFVSFTLDPMLSSVWRDPVEGRFKYLPWLGLLMHRIENGIDRVHVWYGRVLELALRWRKLTLLLALLTFVGSLMLVPLIGGEMMPETDRGYIQLQLQDAGRLEPGIHRQQGAPDRAGAQTVQGNREHDLRRRHLRRQEHRPRQPEADRREEDAPPFAAGDGEGHPRAPAVDRRHRAVGGPQADLHRHPGPGRRQARRHRV